MQAGDGHDGPWNLSQVKRKRQPEKLKAWEDLVGIFWRSWWC